MKSQGYNDRLDERLGSKDMPERDSMQSMKDRRDESRAMADGRDANRAMANGRDASRSGGLGHASMPRKCDSFKAAKEGKKGYSAEAYDYGY